MSACICAYLFFSAATCASMALNSPVSLVTESCNPLAVSDCAAFSASSPVTRSRNSRPSRLAAALAQPVAQQHPGKYRNRPHNQGLHRVPLFAEYTPSSLCISRQFPPSRSNQCRAWSLVPHSLFPLPSLYTPPPAR